MENIAISRSLVSGVFSSELPPDPPLGDFWIYYRREHSIYNMDRGHRICTMVIAVAATT